MLFSSLSAGLRGSVGNRVSGLIQEPYNADADGYVAKLVTASYTVTQTERVALARWFAAGLFNGWYAKIYDFGLMTWGSSAPCLLRGKVGGSVTLPAGSAAYTNKRVTFSSNGYYNLGFSPSTGGMATTGLCHGMAMVGTISDGTGVDMGVNQAPTAYMEMFCNAYTTNTYRGGNAGTAAVTGGASGNNPGLYVGNRVSGQMDLIRYNGTKTTLGTRSDATSGGIPTINFFLGATNTSGAAQFPTNRAYTFWFTGTGFTSTQCDTFMVDTWQLLTSLGAT